MNLIDEEHCAFSITLFGLRLLDSFAQVFHTREDCRQGNESQATAIGEQTREGRLACAGSAPENQRRQRTATREESSQNASLAHEVRLADKLRERTRPHAFR